MSILNILLTICVVVQVFSSPTLNDLNKLRDHLFAHKKYNKFARPKLDQSDPTILTIHFRLTDIHDLNEVSQSLSSSALLNIDWLDEVLTWNPSHFGGIDELFLSQSEIWKPELVLHNGVTKLSLLGDDSLQVIVKSDGKVEWKPFEVFETKCEVDLSYYPFDFQSCTIEFVNWNTLPTYIRIRIGAHEGTVTQVDSSEWDVNKLDSEIYFESRIEIISFTVNMKRKPHFFAVNMVFPVVLLGILDVFTFWLPASAGEKMSFSVTIYLAFAVFLNVVSSLLPVNSKSVGVISIYLLYHLVQGAIIIIITCIQLRMLNWDGIKTVPRILKWITLFSFKLRCRSHRVRNAPANPDRTRQLPDTEEPTALTREQIRKESNAKRLSTSSIQDVTDNEPSAVIEKEMAEQKVIVTWCDVSASLDSYCFLLFSVILFGATMTLFCVPNRFQESDIEFTPHPQNGNIVNGNTKNNPSMGNNDKNGNDNKHDNKNVQNEDMNGKTKNDKSTNEKTANKKKRDTSETNKMLPGLMDKFLKVARNQTDVLKSHHRGTVRVESKGKTPQSGG